MIEQVSVFLENKSGRLAELARTLGDAGVNMHALIIADTAEFGVVRIICDNPEHAKQVLDEQGFGASTTRVLAVEVPDTPGGLADMLEALDAEGLNVEYAYVFVEPGGKAIHVFKVDDARAEDVLGASGYRVVAPGELYSPDA